MGKLMYQGIQYTGGGSEGESIIYMTKAEYDQITPEEDQLYGIIDWDSEAVALIKDGVIVNNATWSSQKMVNTFAQKTQISNRNLLDNPWFTINQRGQSSYTGSNVYAVDRWKITGTLSVSDNGITFTTNAQYSGFTQCIPKDVFEPNRNYTVTYRLANGTYFAKTFTYVESTNWTNIWDNNINGWYSAYRTINGVVEFIALDSRSSAETTASIRAIKLELGSISTLALDTIPNYAEELLKCQRYFVRIGKLDTSSGYGKTISVAPAFQTTAIWFPVYLPVPMRTAPSSTVNGSFKVTPSGTASAVATLTSLPSTNFGKPDNIVNLSCVVDNAPFTVGQFYKLATPTTYTQDCIDLSADL